MLQPASVLSQASAGRLANLCRSISLTLAASLAFLVPFDAVRNIDLQGLLLIVSGAFAWSALLFDHREMLKSYDRLSQVLLGVFLICCLISFLINPHLGYDFFGAPYIRLGLAGFLACIGIGLLARTVPRRQLLIGLYVLIVGMAIVALPYSWFRFHSPLRIGGVFAQADIFAGFVGCGLVFGLETLKSYPKHRQALAACQVFLAVMLLLTQTRAVLLLVIVIWLLWMFQHRSAQSLRRAGIYAAAILLLFATLHYVVPSRLTDTGYASRSISYRLTLQKYALGASWQKPLLGYGPGNLADPLSCERLIAKSLQRTCNEGYFFNSSHNIFIDRVLAVGWLGGLAFLGLVVLAIYRGFRYKNKYGVLGYALVLISCYYLTNVTSAGLELLLWILLLQCLPAPVELVSRGGA
jgi:O-antigen ligase